MKIKEQSRDLEKILEKSSSTIENNVPSNEVLGAPELQGGEPLLNVDFDDLQLQCNAEALTMITNAVKLILPEEMIENNQYVQSKLQLDAFSLAGMIYQIKSNTHVQKALNKQIDDGFAHPRMFEVAFGMAKTINEMYKQLIQSVEALKFTYKDIKQDIRDIKNEALGPQSNVGGILTTGDGGAVVRGTKELIKRINSDRRAENERKNITEVFEINEDESSII